MLRFHGCLDRPQSPSIWSNSCVTWSDSCIDRHLQFWVVFHSILIQARGIELFKLHLSIAKRIGSCSQLTLEAIAQSLRPQLAIWNTRITSSVYSFDWKGNMTNFKTWLAIGWYSAKKQSSGFFQLRSPCHTVSDFRTHGCNLARNQPLMIHLFGWFLSRSSRCARRSFGLGICQPQTKAWGVRSQQLRHALIARILPQKLSGACWHMCLG